MDQTPLADPASIAELERLVGPFDDPEWRADLVRFAEGGRELSRRFAGDAVLLARLARRVPRCRGDDRGGTPWTSFLREVAVARRASDRAVHAEVRAALQLVDHLPRTLALLTEGVLPVAQARALIDMTWICEHTALPALDALAERACRLSPWRVREVARKVLLRNEAEAVAARAAAAARVRGVRRTALPDEQAEIALTGPALPLAQAFAALETDAAALRAAGDPRGIDALRFDLAVHRLLGAHAPVVVRTGPAAAGAARSPRAGEPSLPPDCSDGLPDPTTPAWWTDRRFARPVRLDVTVPVTTALGLSDEPGWLDGYGWISAPQCRQLLPRAELRQLCVSDTGQVVDAADRVLRPEPTPAAAFEALRRMVLFPYDITCKTWREESQHDPSPALDEFARLRGRFCDGPTGARVPAARADLDHDERYPDGPTAAWNLTARARRTHLLKHRGWTALRTATGTLWFSPAGQVVEVDHWDEPPPELDDDACLPDPTVLAAIEAELLRPLPRQEEPPWCEPPP